MRKILLGLLLLVAIGARAVDFRTLEADFIPDSYSSVTSAASSTHSVSGLGKSYSIWVQGSTVAYTIHYTTKTYKAELNYSPSVSSSVVHTTPPSIAVNGNWFAPAINPSIVLHGLNTAATAYIMIEYLRHTNR